MEWTPENNKNQALAQPIRLRWNDASQLPTIYNNNSSFNTRWFEYNGIKPQSINVAKMVIVELKTQQGVAQLLFYPLRNENGELIVYATEVLAGNCYIR